MTTDAETGTAASHDKIFKKLLEWFLPDFIQLFFAPKAAHLDLDTLSFVNQELILPLPGETRRITDVVAEVNTISGDPETILVHVEVEASQKIPLPQRMFEYYAMLRLLRQMPVLPLALVLFPNAGGLSRQTYREQLFGEDVLTLTYGQVALRDLQRDAYFDAHNPLAATVATLMKTETPGEAKLASLRSIFYHPTLTEDRRLFLMKMIDTYLPNESIPNLGVETMEALEAFEYHWSEKVREEGRQEGHQEGRQEGRQEGHQEILLRLLTIKFGQLPADFVARLQAITDMAILDQISEQILTAESLAEITLPAI